MSTEVNSNKKYDEKQNHGSDAKMPKLRKMRNMKEGKEEKKIKQRVISSQRKVKLIWHYNETKALKMREWERERARESERRRERERENRKWRANTPYTYTLSNSKQSECSVDAAFFRQSKDVKVKLMNAITLKENKDKCKCERHGVN